MEGRALHWMCWLDSCWQLLYRWFPAMSIELRERMKALFDGLDIVASILQDFCNFYNQFSHVRAGLNHCHSCDIVVSPTGTSNRPFTTPTK